MMENRPATLSGKTAAKASHRRRPADECPYPRPFQADFADCPAFQVQHLIVLDSQDNPLKPIWTCRNLESREPAHRRGSYYASCRLGDAAARERWARWIGLERIAATNRLRSGVMPLAQRFVDTIAALSRRQVEALAGREDTTDIRLGMEAVGREYLAELATYLSERQLLLAQAQMPRKAILEMARQWVEDVITDVWTTPTSHQALPQRLLARLPDSVRDFYSPPAS